MLPTSFESNVVSIDVAVVEKKKSCGSGRLDYGHDILSRAFSVTHTHTSRSCALANDGEMETEENYIKRAHAG